MPIHVRLTMLTLGLVLTSWAAPGSHAENWPHWRGPLFTGASAELGIPETFNKTENVLWAAPMPGPAAATPIIWGNHVFVSSVNQESKTLLALCLDATDGRTLWQHEIGPGISKDDRSNFASGSPTTDGHLVYYYYGNGDLVAFDFTGKQAWSRNIQKDYGQFAFQWTFSSSPTLLGGKLYLQVLQRNVPVNGRGRSDGPNDSYLLALDPATGGELWKHLRPAAARQESLEAYSTPIPYTHGGTTEILITGGDCLTGHDPATGQELWRWGTWNPSKIPHWRMVVSPVGGGGVVLACAPKGSPVYAVKAGGKGNLDDSALAWVSQDREVSSDVSTPLYYKEKFFILNSDRRVLSCVEPATGRVLWTGNLESRAKVESSPTGVGDRIYMMNQRGDVFVASAGPEFKLLHTTFMGDEGDGMVRSTIAASDGKLFIRTANKLYCVGKR